MLDNLKEFMQISEQTKEPGQFVSYEFDPEAINERIQSQVEVYRKQLLDEKIARLSTPHRLVGLDPDLEFGVQVAHEREGDMIVYKVNTDSAPALKQEFVERVSSALMVNAQSLTGLEVIPEQTLSIVQSSQEIDKEVSNTLGNTNYKESVSDSKEEMKQNKLRTPRLIIHSKSAKSEPLEANFSEKIQFSTFEKRSDRHEALIDSNPSSRSPVPPDIKTKSRDNSQTKPRRHGLSGVGSAIVSSLPSQETVEAFKFSPRLNNQEVPNTARKSSLYSDPNISGHEVYKSTSQCEENNKKLHGSPTLGNKFQDLDSGKMPISIQSATSPKTVSTPNRKTKMNENLKSSVYAKTIKKPTIDKPEKPKKLVIIYPNLPITTQKDLSSAYGNIFDSKPKSRTGNRKNLSNVASPKVEGSSRLSTRSYVPSKNPL